MISKIFSQFIKVMGTGVDIFGYLIRTTVLTSYAYSSFSADTSNASE